MRFVVAVAVFLAAVAAVAAVPAAVAVLFCLVQKERCGLLYAFAPGYYALHNVSPVPVWGLFGFLS